MMLILGSQMPYSDPEEHNRRVREQKARERRTQRRRFTKQLHERRTKAVAEGKEPPWEPTPSQNDPLVVSTKHLAAAVQEFLDEWGYSGLDRSDLGMVDDDLMTGAQYLCELAGITNRTLWRVTSCETEWTSLDLADKILTAMGEGPRIATDPLLRPRPNPRWSQERWMKWKEDQGGCV